MNTLILSIDPGASGGICISHPEHSVEAHKMPDTPKDVCDLLTIAKETAEMNGMEIKAYMEELWGYAGGPGQPGSAMFQMGRGYGAIEGFLICLGIPFELVPPNKWQRAMSVPVQKIVRGQYDGLSDQERSAEKKRITNLNAANKRAKKNHMKEMAQRLYPNVKVTLDTADALLILEWAKRQGKTVVETEQVESLVR